MTYSTVNRKFQTPKPPPVERPTAKMPAAAIAALVAMTLPANERPTVKMPAVDPERGVEAIDLGW
jgi:hypothetical protein